MANWLLHSFYFFTCVSFLPSHLYRFYLSLVYLYFLLPCFSLSYYCSALLSLSLPFVFFTSPSLYISLPFYAPFLFPHLYSHLFPSLLPLFRLCKVQLGFGAFGLQAWQQEDALSEYALLGSLCVTLYFFALLFLPLILTYFCSYFFTPVSVKSRSSCLPMVSFFDGGRPSASDITSVLQKTGVAKKVSFSRKP